MRRPMLALSAALVCAFAAAWLASCGGTAGTMPSAPSARTFGDAGRTVVAPSSPVPPSPSPAPTAAKRVYVTDTQSNAVTEYGFYANGDPKPVAKVAGSNTLLSSPVGVGFDAAGQTYVLGNASFAVFAAGARGNAAPRFFVAGGLTGLTNPQGIAVDPTGVTYVTDDGSSGYITVYAPGSNGDRAPVRTIYDVTSFLFVPAGIALHGTHLYVADPGDQTVNEYLASSNGDVSPTDVIDIGGNPSGIAVDPNGLIYVTDGNAVVVYAANAKGNDKPLRVISGPLTGLANPAGVTVSGTVIEVANTGGPSVTEYARTANGDVAPKRTISGPNTLLATPTSVGVF